ncbi:MAG: YhdP family protein [Gammaproteobacteria bacterium]|nr:YhdP family protein [Gammaproteobacteria bacterium]
MLSRIIKALYHFTVYTVAVIVLIAAVSVSLIRLALPDIGEYRGEIEAWVSHYMGFPVVIRSIDATWKGWTPQLYLTDIDLLNKAGTKPITRFDHARISLNPIATVIKRQFISRSLMISGFELSVEHLSNGAIYVEGINIEGLESAQAEKNELAEWLFRQDEIEIQNATIEWLDVKHQQAPILLTDVNLTLRSDVDRLQIEGSTTLPSKYGHKMDFAFDVFGDLLTSDWSGELYLSGNNINPDNWYTDYRPLDFNITGGSADLKVWSTWQQARLVKLDGELQYNDFNALSGNTRLHIKELDYRFSGQRLDDAGWQFKLNLSNLLTEHGLWPITDIFVLAEPVGPSGQYRYTTSFSYLKLDDLAPLVANLAFLPVKAKKLLGQISIDGELSNGRLVYDPSQVPAKQFLYEIEFEHLTTGFSDQLPVFDNLSGQLYGSLTEGNISLHANSVTLHFPSMDEKKIWLAELSGNVDWSRNSTGWQLKSDLIYIKTSDFSANLTGSLSKHKDNPAVFMDLVMNVGQTELERLSDYLPQTPRFRLKSWLERAIQGGSVEYANAIFRGYLNDFPFDRNNGRFELIANVNNVSLDYSPAWPPVDQIDSEIIFNGRQMQANIHSGKIFNADITKAYASIADILKKHKTIILNGQISGETKDLTLFVAQSPLHKDLTLNELKGAIKGGHFTMGLELDIPLKQKAKKPKVNGHVSISDITLTSSLEKLQLKEVSGDLAFTRDSVSSETLSARYLEQPVELTISGSKDNKDNPPSIRINGMADEKFITDRVIEYVPSLSPISQNLLERLSGETAWQAKLTYLRGEHHPQLNKQIEISSDLAGLAVDLPAPIGKTKHLLFPIKLTTNITQGISRNIDIQYGSILVGKLELDNSKQQRLQKASLHFGDTPEIINNEHDIFINGSIDKLPVNEWLEILKLLKTDSRNDRNNDRNNSIKADLQISSLALFNQSFSNIRLIADKTESTWHINLDGDDITGDIILPDKLDRDSQITLDLEKLSIRKTTPDKHGQNSTNPLNMPALKVNVADFVYLDRNMGRMQLQATPVEKGLSIDHFEFTKPSLQIKGHGAWLVHKQEENSRFNIELHADHIDAMLETFGYRPTSIKGGKTSLQIDADWPGSPMEFSLENLNGTLDMNIGKGRFLDINPSAGRLFGLLSIQTLPRRLSLDFTDLFGKGLAFDKIEGHFDITDGNAYTNDLYMRGPSADVVVTGRTGLSDQDYDQLVTVTPQVSSSLPVASAVFGPVGIGIGALLYLGGKMFKSINIFDKILRYQYTITGSWDTPNIEKIKPRNKTSGG